MATSAKVKEDVPESGWLFSLNSTQALAKSLDLHEPQAAMPSVVVNEVLRTACDCDSKRFAVLERAGVPAESLTDPNGSISLQQFGAIWRSAIRETGDELLNLDRRGMARGTFSLMCVSMLSSRTLRETLERLLLFWSILLEDFKATLSIDGPLACINISERGENRSTFAYAIIISSILGPCSWLIDRRIAIRHAEVRSEGGVCEEFFRSVVCRNVEFNRLETRFYIDSDLLQSRPIRNGEQLTAFLARCPESVIMPYFNRDSVSAKVHKCLREAPPEHWPSFPRLATSLAMTPSTLRRRLADEGASYQSIKDEIRREQAVTKLTFSNQSIVEIAEDLGFSDPSTFYRAFKKWTGITPSLYREPGCTT